MQTVKPKTKTLNQRQTDTHIVKPAELIEIREISESLTLADRRIFNMLLANAWDNIKEPVFHTIRLHELRSSNQDNSRPRDSIKRLMQVIISFDVIEDGINREVITHLLGDCKLDHNPHGLAHYSFSDSMRKMLVFSSVFARLRRDLIYQFRSKYALTLYEMLQKRINLSHKTSDDFTIDEIRQKLGVAKEINKIYRDLNTNVLKPAVLEVNKLSDIACSFDPIIENRVTVGIRLSWRKKEIEETFKSVNELQNNSAVRKERIRGQVVQIFPNQNHGNATDEPNKIDNRVRELNTRECEQLKKTFFGYDIYSLYNEFQIWIDKTQGEIPDSPPAAFTNWLKNYYKITGPRRT
jgi:hypothetical protein